MNIVNNETLITLIQLKNKKFKQSINQLIKKQNLINSKTKIENEQRLKPHRHEHEVWHIISGVLLQAGQTNPGTVPRRLFLDQVSVQGHQRIAKELQHSQLNNENPQKVTQHHQART